MTPIKLTDLKSKRNAETPNALVLDLIDLGLYYAAPRENDHPIVAMRLDQNTGTLFPV